MTKIFISYGRENKQVAVQIYESLKEAGYEPWLDAKSLVPGENWERAIRLAISQATVMIALLSSSSVNRRGYVHAEIREGLELRKQFPEDQIYLIPVRLEDFEPPQLDIRGIHWLDFFLDDGLTQLLSAVDVAARRQQHTSKENDDDLRTSRSAKDEPSIPNFICGTCLENIKHGARICRHCKSRIEYVSARGRFLTWALFLAVPAHMFMAAAFSYRMNLNFYDASLASFLIIVFLTGAIYFNLDQTKVARFYEQ